MSEKMGSVRGGRYKTTVRLYVCSDVTNLHTAE